MVCAAGRSGAVVPGDVFVLCGFVVSAAGRHHTLKSSRAHCPRVSSFRLVL